MSGGGGGGKSKPKETVEKVAYDNIPTVQTFQPSLPGFTDMIASQLMQGFGGGGGGEIAGLLNNLYSPMDVYKFREPISVTAGMYDDKKYLPIETGNAALDTLLMGKKIGEKKK